jgi:hypothetical protein
MPGYTNMPSDWATELAKKVTGRIYPDVIFNPDNLDSVHFNGRIFIQSIDLISIKTELDVNWAMRPTLAEFGIQVIDADELFNIKNSSSPFYLCYGVLADAAVAGNNFIKVTEDDMANFMPGNMITITDGTNLQTVIVTSAGTASSKRTVYFTEALDYAFAAGSYVFTQNIEGKKIAIDLRLASSTQPFRVFLGNILAPPEFNFKKAAFIVTDLRKSLMDSTVIGADSASGTKLKTIDTSGTLVSSINWVTGSGTLDRSKITVHPACRLGKWTINFESATSYTISGPGHTDEKSILVSAVDSIANADKVTGFSDLQGVYIEDNKAYVCDKGADTFYIYDISDIDNVTLLDSIADADDLNGCRDCVVVGDYAYVVSEIAGTLVTIDVSDPTNISIVNVQTPSSALKAIATNGSCLYSVSYDDDALYVHDIRTTPAIPLYKTEITTAGSPNYMGGAYDVKVCSNKLYVSAYDDSAVTVWDLTDVADAKFLAVEEIAGTTAGIDVVSDIVYVTLEASDTLALYDFSDHYNIALLDSIAGSGSPNYLDNICAVKVLGNFAFCLGKTDNSLVIIDCSDTSNIVLDSVVTGTGSPYYLEDATAIDIVGDKVVVVSETDAAISCFELGFNISNDLVTEQLTIPVSAWSGEINTGDQVEFWTGITFNDLNIIQALYNIYIKKLDNKWLDCSSFFGDKVIGTLYQDHTASDTTLLIKVDVPIIIPDSDTLTIIEGATSENVTVAVSGGNAEATSFPPYISLTVSALANSYTSAATVTWKQRGSRSSHYSFDNEYDYCTSISASLKWTVTKEMNYQQLILLILAHLNSFNFQNNYGVECITTLRSESTAGVPVLAYNTNLKNLEVETIEMANKFIADYKFNYLTDEYDGRVTYPDDDTINDSYLRYNAIKQPEVVKLPGFLTETLAEANLTTKYNFYRHGVTIYRADVTLQGLNLPIGSIVQIQSLYPSLTAYAKVIGFDISMKPYNIKLVLLDISTLL